jgi:glutaminyl-peptide cyclotransferase
MNSFLKHAIFWLFCLKLFFIANITFAETPKNLTLSYEVISERTHKPSLFTQGLLVSDENFYESSGLYGQSLLVSYPITEPESTWEKLSAPFSKKQELPKQYFAEGLTLLNDKLYLLTWQEKTLLIFDKKTLNYEKSMHYQGEGWGLTTNGKELIRSDGSDQLFFHKADDFSVIKQLSVIDNNNPVTRLNELEFAQSYIWANIWYEDAIIKINPTTGQVEGKLHLADLRKKMPSLGTDAVLNGIAWDEKRQAFWVTGKNWPKLFLVKIKSDS